MDVERAIEHLLQLHAKAEARMEKHDARMDKHDARMVKVDRRLTAMSNLMQIGMRALREQNIRINMLIEAQMRSDHAQEELRKTVKQLAESQKAYFDSLRKGRNGRK